MGAQRSQSRRPRSQRHCDLVIDVTGVGESTAATRGEPAADQAQFDLELAALRKANAAVYARRTPWKRK